MPLTKSATSPAAGWINSLDGKSNDPRVGYRERPARRWHENRVSDARGAGLEAPEAREYQQGWPHRRAADRGGRPEGGPVPPAVPRRRLLQDGGFSRRGAGTLQRCRCRRALPCAAPVLALELHHL